MSIASLIACVYLFQTVASHGFLSKPVSRSSAWLYRQDFKSCCTHYDHNQMFCGGFDVQWSRNRGRCSICGENYALKKKLFSKGGSKYRGTIVETYHQGETIQTIVNLTANHLGTFEFRVCSLDQTPDQDATQECLNLNQLVVNDQGKSFAVRAEHRNIVLRVRLPANLACEHCVFQWKYRTGNSWGASAGRGCLGCGEANEEFYGCSDIAILPGSGSDETSGNERRSRSLRNILRIPA